MFHWFGVVQNTRGDSLPGWQVGLVDLNGMNVTIFADENRTPIQTVSGIPNRAVADDFGNYDFFVPSGTYTLQFFNREGEFQRAQRFVAMFGADAANTANLASNDAGKGASLVATEGSGTVQTALNARPTSATLAASGGSALVGFTQSGDGVVARTVQDKLRERVSVDDYGAAGDNATDDKAAIQAALNSSAKEIRFTQGKTYVVDGGLTLSRPGVKIIATGATIRLKANATTAGILTLTGGECEVIGGEWDGNKANGNIGTWGSAQFSSFAVNLAANGCTMREARVKDFWGIGIKGLGNNLSALNNVISGTQHYGIFFDGAAGVSYSGNRAIGNRIDMSAGQVVGDVNQGQGILFAAATEQAQTDYELADNYITGPQTSVTDQAINLAVRGRDGIVSNNTTRFGAMGFSEGGDNCVVSGNRFLDLVGTTRLGVEPSGRATVSGNVITGAYVGIDCNSANVNYNESAFTGNTITAVSGGSVSIGIRLQIEVARTGNNISITGNTIRTTVHGVYATRDCAGLTISGNIFVGPGVNSGRGVFLDGLPAAAFVSVIANTFRGFLRPWSVFNGSAVTYTDLYAANNHCIDCGSTRTTWPTEGSATIGQRACVLGAEYGRFDTIDASLNVVRIYGTSFNNPEGHLTAGIGSQHFSLNSGGGAYYKATGTGNTGWTQM